MPIYLSPRLENVQTTLSPSVAGSMTMVRVASRVQRKLCGDLEIGRTGTTNDICCCKDRLTRSALAINSINTGGVLGAGYLALGCGEDALLTWLLGTHDYEF